MPAALDVNWEAIKMLAMEVGVREAARQMGISENTVKRKCTLEGWLVNLPRSTPMPASVVRYVPNVPNPSNLLANAMREDSLQTRASAIRITRRALKRAEQCDDDELMVPEVAGVINQHTKTAALAGAWQAQSVAPKISLHLTGQTPVTIDAEIVSGNDAQVPDLMDLDSF